MSSIIFLKKYWKLFVCIILIITLLFLFRYLYCYFDNVSNLFFEGSNTPRGEFLKVLLTFIAGIVGILVWITSVNRVKAMEKQTEKTTKQIEVAIKGNLDSRFNNAVGHLGNESPTVVLGGIHVLHQIAVENKNYTQIVHNLFCSYLRENSSTLYDSVDFKTTPTKCPIIIQTIVDFLFKPYNNEKSVYFEFKSDLSFSKLINCNFQRIDIKKVSFDYCILENCDFTGDSIKNNLFSDSTFYHSTITNCSFNNRNMSNCYFSQSSLSDCHFRLGTYQFYFEGLSSLTSCDFIQSTFTECSFSFTKLNKCSFFISKLYSCKFELSFIYQNNFSDSLLSQCNFNGFKPRYLQLDYQYNYLINCDFSNSTLDMCEFSSRFIEKTNFENSEIIGLDNFKDAFFIDDCNFSNATFNYILLPSGDAYKDLFDRAKKESNSKDFKVILLKMIEVVSKETPY